MPQLLTFSVCRFPLRPMSWDLVQEPFRAGYVQLLLLDLFFSLFSCFVLLSFFFCNLSTVQYSNCTVIVLTNQYNSNNNSMMIIIIL